MKKPWYKTWWVWVIAGVVVLAIIGAAMDKGEEPDAAVVSSAQSTETPDGTPISTPERTPEPTPKPTLAPTPTPFEMPTPSVDAETALALLQSNFDGIADVEYDDALMNFSIIPTGDAFIADLMDVANGDASKLEDWSSLGESFKTLSSSLSGYILTLANPTNPDNALLVAYEGIIVYDFTTAS